MKFRLSVAVVVSALLLAMFVGCNGVNLNAQYSTLLDQTAALSKETADRNRSGSLSPAQVQQSFDGQAAVWQSFRDARDGKSATTQP